MPEWLLQLGGIVFTAGAIYGAIRGDLKSIAKDAEGAKNSATHAHRRIDDHIDRHHVRTP